MRLDIENRDEMANYLESVGYIADSEIATAVYLAVLLERPLLIEGQPGAGKTELAKALASLADAELVRLQCYRGLEAEQTLYEWDHMKQFLSIRIAGELADDPDPSSVRESIFEEEYLLERPILTAIREGENSVLLVDELDRANEEFEAFLLEVLDEFQVTVPELGAIEADTLPLVVITSNRTRAISDAIKRRCLYLHMRPPDFERELTIVKNRVPELEDELARDLVTFVQRMRSSEPLLREPGVSETIDWAEAFHHLDVERLSVNVVRETLTTVLKEPQDVERFDVDAIEELVDDVQSR